MPAGGTDTPPIASSVCVYRGGGGDSCHCAQSKPKPGLCFFYVEPGSNDAGPGFYLYVSKIGPPMGARRWGLRRFLVGMDWPKKIVISRGPPTPLGTLGPLLVDNLVTMGNPSGAI